MAHYSVWQKMDCEIRDTREDEAKALSDIRVESKGHWGYARETLEAWRTAMKVSPDYIRANAVRSIFLDGRLVGFYALKRAEEDYLDHLWLLPDAIGKGIGRLALEHAVRLARESGIRTLVIISDVDAEGFYLKLGARKIGEVFSPHQNRMLPKLSLPIQEEPNQ